MRLKTLTALAVLTTLAACGQKEEAKPETAAAPGAENGSPAAQKADAAGSPPAEARPVARDHDRRRARRHHAHVR